jgi:histidinol-phosphate aminotransferase
VVGAEPPIKLSSNENPFGPLAAVREAIAVASASIHRYPDMLSAELTEALARRHDLADDRVAVGAGSVAVLGHTLQAFCEQNDEVIYAWRSFEAYPILVTLAAATPVEVPLQRDKRHDLTAMAEAVTAATKVVILCSPNNPTGPAIGLSEFEAFMAKIPRHVLVILDEAYGEFVTDPSSVRGRESLDRFPQLVVARTFSKAYGLAGLRVGYALGQRDIVSAIRATTTPFSLSGIAQSAALASLEAESELLARVDQIVLERERLLAALRDDGWSIPNAQGNFVWIAAGEAASDLAAHCAGAAPPILVRPFAGDGVRITVGSREENDRVLSTLATYPTRT